MTRFAALPMSWKLLWRRKAKDAFKNVLEIYLSQEVLIESAYRMCFLIKFLESSSYIIIIKSFAIRRDRTFYVIRKRNKLV